MVLYELNAQNNCENRERNKKTRTSKPNKNAFLSISIQRNQCDRKIVLNV